MPAVGPIRTFLRTVANHPMTWGGRAWTGVERAAVRGEMSGLRMAGHTALGLVGGVPNMVIGAASAIPRVGIKAWKSGTTGKVVVGAGAAAAAAGTAYGVMGSHSKGMDMPPEMLETQAQLDQNQQVLDGMMQQQAMMQPAMTPMQESPYNQAQPVVGGQMAYEGPITSNEQGIAQV